MRPQRAQLQPSAGALPLAVLVGPQVGRSISLPSRLIPGKMLVARSVFVLLVALMILVGSSRACAEVWRVSPKVNEYFRLLFPGAPGGRFSTPLVLVLPSADRVEHVIAPFSGEERDSNIEELLEILSAERVPERAVPHIVDERFLEAVAALGRELPLQFPLVVLVRMETSRPGEDPQLPTASDESLEDALRAWESQEAGARNVLILALEPR